MKNTDEKVEAGMTLQNIKDNIAVWAVCAIVGLANYQLAKLNDAVSEIKGELSTLSGVTNHHSIVISEQKTKLKELEEKNGQQDVEIGKIQVRLERIR